MENKSRYCTKQTGKTEVYPFKNIEDIKNMMDYFLLKEQWHHYLTFMLGLLLGRRVGDCLSLSWSDLYYKNGKMKDEIDTLQEEKTGKMTRPFMCNAAKEAILLYIWKTGVNPMEDYELDIFESKLKANWREHCKTWEGYQTNTYMDVNRIDAEDKIYQWAELIKKNNTKAGNPKIQYEKWINRAKKCRGSLSLEKYLMDEEYSLAIRSMSGAYRTAFKEGAEFCDINYPVSTHTPRKSFGMWSRILHPHDMDSMVILQKIYGHSSQQITMDYIGLTREKEIKYYTDMGDFIVGIAQGEKPKIKNTPIISVKTNDLRDILSKAYLAGKNHEGNSNDITIMNQLLSMVEEMRVS